MGSTLLYGTLFCLILWWLIRYYLLPWWRQDKQPGYPERRRPAQKNAEPDTIPLARADSTVDSNANLPLQTPDTATGDMHARNQSDSLTSVSNRQAVADNGSHRQTNETSEQPIVETAGLSSEADEIDLNATTDLQGQLQILHKEKEKVRGRFKSAEARSQARKNWAQQHRPAANTVAESQTIPREESPHGSEQDVLTHIATLEKQLDENNRDITMLCSQLKEARLFETRFHENDKRMAEQQTQLLQKDDELNELRQQIGRVTGLEARLAEKDQSIAELKSDIATAAVQHGELNAQVQRMTALETDLREKNQAIHQLTLKADKVTEIEKNAQESSEIITELTSEITRLESAIVAKDEEISVLRAGSDSITHDTANHTVTNQAVTNEAVTNRAVTNQAAPKLDALETALQEKDQQTTSQQLARLQQAESELQESQQRIHDLGAALAKAEEESKTSRQNDLELRRLRSELQSVTQERDKYSAQVKSLDERVQQQLQTPDTSTTQGQAHHEIEKLEADIQHRDEQINTLQQRLDSLQSAARQPATRQREASSTGSASRPVQPLFQAPEEKDDLKKIKGIGPVMEKTLYSLGVTSFKQLSEFTQADTDKVSSAIGAFPGRIERDNWVGGAREQFLKKYGSKAGV